MKYNFVQLYEIWIVEIVDTINGQERIVVWSVSNRSFNLRLPSDLPAYNMAVDLLGKIVVGDGVMIPVTMVPTIWAVD